MEIGPIIIGLVLVALTAGGIGTVMVRSRGAAGAGGRRGGGGNVRSLMTGGNSSMANPRRYAADGTRPGLDVDDIKRMTKVEENARPKRKADDLDVKLFRAGYFSAEERRQFAVSRVTSLAIFTVGIPAGLYLAGGGGQMVVLGLCLGVGIGFVFPLSRLDKKIRFRQEETLYFLPLVIEQVSIGVSSSLDIGPCIAHITEMATDRDSHNPVTEMFVHSQRLMRSGMNLEEALVEVAEANGMSEVKHAFMFLAQCARHGGEITKQLQELADSVMTQRQVQVEARITALPVKATGPLATVFAGFFALLFAGLCVRLMTAFGG